VAKAEWGLKRVCAHCGARFYDMRKDPIVCPKCGTTHDPVAQLRPRRQAREEPAKVAAKPVPPPVADEEALVADVDEEAAAEEEEEETIEDASELGEDEDDVAEVLDNVDEEDDR